MGLFGRWLIGTILITVNARRHIFFEDRLASRAVLVRHQHRIFLEEATAIRAFFFLWFGTIRPNILTSIHILILARFNLGTERMNPVPIISTDKPQPVFVR